MRRVPSRSAATDSRGDEDDVVPLHSVIGGKLRFSFAVAIFCYRRVTAVLFFFLQRAREWWMVRERPVLNVVSESGNYGFDLGSSRGFTIYPCFVMQLLFC